eukprot:15346275-Ditylum_brightwellii.AAC.1
MWSIGVVAYSILGGYQPFHAKEDFIIEKLTINGNYKYDDKYWRNISDEAKNFISTLLVTSPHLRSSAEVALQHHWFNVNLNHIDKVAAATNTTEIDKPPVFFMIGSQRSGSNWLRTMLGQREDLVGPHPPHIMRDFMPIIGKFGDLSEDAHLRILVDHVCTFVERNQVVWTDKHGLPIVICRHTVHCQAKASCDRLLVNRCAYQASTESASHDPAALGEKLYLLSIFDAVMDFLAKANGKISWICKSMGMSRFHEDLLEFYGTERLRYIYLVRDPRDVAMSFMKTPVGDCHYYAIIKKWVNLQECAQKVLSDVPRLVCKVHYEELLQDKESVVNKVYDFMGERRFGGIRRQA